MSIYKQESYFMLGTSGAEAGSESLAVPTRCNRRLFSGLFSDAGAEKRNRLPTSKIEADITQIQMNASRSVDSTVNCDRFFTIPTYEASGSQSLELPSKLLCPEGFRDILPDVDTFIFDADGVLWLGPEVIPGSPSLIELLVSEHKQVIILTNNATKSREAAAKKLVKLGYNRFLDKNSLVNPAMIVADMLHRAGFPGKKKVYLIGPQGVRDEMDALGIEHFGHVLKPQDYSDSSDFISDFEFEEEPSKVGAVVIGYEKHFNYHKLMMAANYLQQQHCLFLATNEDESCPSPNPDIIIPDAGPIVAAVRCASGREPITVGKPNTPSFDYIRRRWNIYPGRTMMVGDRTNTDVKFGRDHGMKTLLVLSGCHQLEHVMKNRINGRLEMVPDFYAPSLGSLVSS